MARIWQSVFLIGLFILTFVLILLLSCPTPGSRGALINIVNVDTWLRVQDTGKVNVDKLKISLNEQGHLENIPHQIGDRKERTTVRLNRLGKALMRMCCLCGHIEKTD